MQIKKSLYDVKQAPEQRYKKFDGFMMEIRCKKCHIDIVDTTRDLTRIIFSYYYMLMVGIDVKMMNG